MNKTKLLLILIISLSLSACCCKTGSDPRDPYELMNRKIYKFNDALDKAILKPTAKVYQTIVPPPLRTASSNFFDNLYLIPTVANDLLQAEFVQAIKDTWRFGINSTLGLAGTLDVAQHMELPRHFNDFGVTLAKWGHHQSAYIMIPFIGPSTVRDGMGKLVDHSVFSIYPYIEPDELAYWLTGYRTVVYRANLLDAQQLVDHAAIDQYVFIRDAYLQYRNNQINKDHDNSEELYIEENE